MSLFEELKRRNVFRVGMAYAVVAWLALQVADIVVEPLGLPDNAIPVLITVLAIGFVPALVLAWVFEMTPQGIRKESDVDRSDPALAVGRRRLDTVIIGVLAAAVLLLLLDRFTGIFGGAETGATAADGAAQSTEATGEVEKSIAVLPFVNMSGDPEQEYFSDGVSEEILNALSKVRELKVAGRTSSFAFKGQNLDLRQIGRTLGVEHILEGSVRKSGSTVRITAQLIQARDGFHLWSETYDRELTNVFAIQDEIAGAILAQLKTTLIGAERQATAARRTVSEAYNLYLLAKQRIYERNRLSLESALDLLDQAIAMDDSYAPAYAQRGITALLLSEANYGDIPKDQAQAQGRLYLDKALELDPGNAEAWAGMGLYHYVDPDGEEASIAALEKALDINPGLINASNWLQNSLFNAGRDEEAMAILDDMVERDPLYRPGFTNFIRIYSERGDLDKVWPLIERVRPFRQNDPAFVRNEATAYFNAGRFGDALPLLDKVLAMGRDSDRDDEAAANLRGRALLGLNAYEHLTENPYDFYAVIALSVLGRTEEASMRAWKSVERHGDPNILFIFLANSGQFAALVDYAADRWGSVEAYEQEYPIEKHDGAMALWLALAYQRTDRDAEFTAVMDYIFRAIEYRRGKGEHHGFRRLIEAFYFALAAEPERAITALENSFATSRTLTMPARLSYGFPVFAELEGDPRYEAIQARNLEHINTERAKMGWDPVSI